MLLEVLYLTDDTGESGETYDVEMASRSLPRSRRSVQIKDAPDSRLVIDSSRIPSSDQQLLDKQSAGPELSGFLSSRLLPLGNLAHSRPYYRNGLSSLLSGHEADDDEEEDEEEC